MMVIYYYLIRPEADKLFQGSLTSAVSPTLGLSDVVESWEPLLSELSQIVRVGKTGAAVELWSILASV